MNAWWYVIGHKAAYLLRLPLPPGHCAGAPDGEEETLEEDVGEEGCAGCSAAAEGGEGEGEGEE